MTGRLDSVGPGPTGVADGVREYPVAGAAGPRDGDPAAVEAGPRIGPVPASERQLPTIDLAALLIAVAALLLLPRYVSAYT